LTPAMAVDVPPRMPMETNSLDEKPDQTIMIWDTSEGYTSKFAVSSWPLSRKVRFLYGYFHHGIITTPRLFCPRLACSWISNVAK